jgi:hypothetical protein
LAVGKVQTGDGDECHETDGAEFEHLQLENQTARSSFIA